MGCMHSTAAASVKEEDWPEDVKNAVKEVEGWDVPAATEAAKKAATEGGDAEKVMAAANAAKEGGEKKAEEEEKPEAEKPEGEKPEAAPEDEAPQPAEAETAA